MSLEARDIATALKAVGRIEHARAAAEAARVVARMIAGGEVSEHAMAALDVGADAFTRALITGDWANAAEVDRRREVCRQCPAHVVKAAPGAAKPSSWCGEPLTPDPDATPPTCGCLLRLKTLVGSQACPAGKW